MYKHNVTYIDYKNKIVICFKCKKVYISSGKSYCEYCEYPTIGVWLTEDRFFGYLERMGLRDMDIIDQRVRNKILKTFTAKGEQNVWGDRNYYNIKTQKTVSSR